jgi:iron complex outermembrane recepter protein
MAYIRLASGYRAGGNNIFGSTSPSSPIPLSFRPDTTKDFELGIKAGVFGEKLFVDASLDHIDWRNLQILSFVPQNELVTYTGNAGAARSDGLELSLEIRPATGLRMNTWVSVNNLGGLVGDNRRPVVSTPLTQDRTLFYFCASLPQRLPHLNGGA